jgi:hypothetical protein
MTSPTRTCASHCRSCDRHFAGDGAFDRHRGGGFAGDGKRRDTRHCKDPARDDWYEAIEGECRISAPNEPPKQIVIWRQAGSAERLQGVGPREGRRSVSAGVLG